MVYRIRIRGRLDQGWTDWFEGLAIPMLSLTCVEDSKGNMKGEEES